MLANWSETKEMLANPAVTSIATRLRCRHVAISLALLAYWDKQSLCRDTQAGGYVFSSECAVACSAALKVVMTAAGPDGADPSPQNTLLTVLNVATAFQPSGMRSACMLARAGVLEHLLDWVQRVLPSLRNPAAVAHHVSA